MKVVITGFKGFVGREVYLQCKASGIDTIGIDTIESDEENYYKKDINVPDIGDIIPESTDAIIHLAALSRDKDCANNSQECFRVNVQGTLNLMAAAEKRNVKNFIFASTEWVYDRFDINEIKDEESSIDAMNLKSEYALSKLVSEVNLRQKYQHGFCNTTILRFGIIYGPRPSNWSAVEAIFNDVRTKDTVSVGSLKTGRCFIHVSDIVSGIIKALDLQGFNLINLQGDRLITLGEIIEVSKKITGQTPTVFEKNPENISVRNISNKKAKADLNWKTEYDLYKGLTSLIRTVI